MLYREIEVDDSALLPKGSIEAAITPLSRPGNDVYWLAFVPDPQATADAAMGALVRQLPVDWALRNRSYHEGRWIVVDGMDRVKGVGATPEAAVQNAFARAKADHDAALEEGEDA